MNGTLFADETASYASSSFPPPREFQSAAHDALRRGVKEGHQRQLLMSPTGSGKTYLGMRIIHEALLRGKRCGFIVDRNTLVEQTSRVADQYGLSAHGIIQAGHWRMNLAMPFQICSQATLARRDWPELDVIVIDECFVGGTLIDTPDGKKRIDTLNSGGLVYNSIGTGVIKSVFCKKVFKTVIVRLSNGTEIECTEDHPIFTDLGWRPAGAVARGTRVFRREDVQELWGGFPPVHCGKRAPCRTPGVGNTVLGAGVLRKILREEIEESDAQFGREREDGGNAKADWSRTEGAGRQWSRFVRDAISLAWDAWQGLAGGTVRKDAQAASAGVSASLQDRRSERAENDCRGNRRRESWFGNSASSGQEERCTATRAWVESVEVVERRGGVNVYNLRVSGHPSYFADGILVHNCHTLYKSWTDHIMQTDAVVIGLSATPFSQGLGLMFTNLVNAATMADLTEQGVLVPMRVFTCTTPDMTDAKTVGGEWSDKEAEQRGMKIIGDVVTEWVKFGENRKTIVFGATIAHCEEMVRQFMAAGVKAATFTSHTEAPEREALLTEYRKPDSKLRVLVSVEALAKGFDVPDVGCVVDCRPLRKSLSTAIQMWGRGLRSSPSTGKVDCLLLDHSGNFIRFAKDYEDIYYNGLDTLDTGEKLDKTIRRDEDKEPTACPKCGHIPMFKRCIKCGHEVHKASMVETLPGEMQEVVMLGKKKLADDHRHLWEQIVTHCRGWGNPETVNGRAWHRYKEISGKEPPKGWHESTTPNVEVTRNVIGKIKSMQIAYHARRRA